MVGSIFTTLIVQPIFNLLVLIYALLPGHNFGLAIIIFTIIIRLLLWPLVKKQLNHAKAMRELQPEIKKIKAAAKGDRQKESQMTMELYKEREINPFASLLIVLVQLPILIGLYAGLNKIIHDAHQIITFSYPFISDLSWIKHLSTNIHLFDNSLLGFVSLSRKAIGPGGIYWPAVVIVVASAVSQYFQSKQLMPQSNDQRSLRQILKDAGQGKQADQSEVNAAVGRGTIVLVPLMVGIFGASLPAALPLYWLTSSVVAIFQQARILKDDAAEADSAVDNNKSGQPPKPSKAPQSYRTTGGLTVTRKTLGDEPKTKNSSKARRANKRRRK